MAWDQEFERELGGAIRERVAPGAMTVIAAWPEPEALAAPRLRSIVNALERHGIARGRQLLVVAPLALPEGAGPPFRPASGSAAFGAEPRDAATPDARARALAAALEIAAIAHDPERSPCFVLGRTPDSVPIEVNDELREAEALVMAAPQRGMGEAASLMELAIGLMSAASRRAVSAAVSEHLDLLARFQPSVSVIWRANGRAIALRGPGRREDLASR